MMRGFVLAAVLSGLVAGVPAAGQDSGVAVRDAWARATASAGRTGGVFMTMTATGREDRVLSASSPVAERVELHETVRDGDVMRMREVPNLVLKPGVPAVLRPGGQHLMLMGLKQRLNQGESFALTLTFEKAPPVTVTVTVQAAGAGHRH
jgi:copper(I)-binding protein